jgi:hypothetical protein
VARKTNIKPVEKENKKSTTGKTVADAKAGPKKRGRPAKAK